MFHADQDYKTKGKQLDTQLRVTLLSFLIL